MQPSMASAITDAVRNAGPVAIAGLMFVETLFPPIPSEVVLPFAGFLIAQGDLAAAPALIAATLGAVAGALILYVGGRTGGKRTLLRVTRPFGVRSSDIERADRWFDRYGGKAVFLGRMVPGVRSLVSIPAGVSEMPIGRFTLLTIAGSAIWNSVLITAGYVLGDRWERASALVDPIATAVVVVLVLIVATFVGRRWWAARSGRRSSP